MLDLDKGFCSETTIRTEVAKAGDSAGKQPGQNDCQKREPENASEESSASSQTDLPPHPSSDCNAQHSFCFSGCQTLIPKNDRNAEMLVKAIRELARVLTLPTFIAAHVQRFTGKQSFNFKQIGNLLQILQIFADARALERLNALRGNSQRVTDREPDAFLTHVEGENASGRHFKQFRQIWIIEGIGRRGREILRVIE